MIWLLIWFVAACATDEIPLHAELRWTTEGALVFDVTSITRRVDLPVQELATPPATATFAAEPLPSSPGEVLLPRGELTAFRNAAVEAPPVTARDAQAPLPDSGLVLVNASDELRVAWLDGAPVAWVAPGARFPLNALLHGKYALQWRTFLGDAFGGRMCDHIADLHGGAFPSAPRQHGRGLRSGP